MKTRLIMPALVACVATAPVAAQQQQQGTEISWRMTSSMSNGGPVEWTLLSAGDRMRIDIDLARLASARGAGPGRSGEVDVMASTLGGMLGGTYLLTLADGKVAMIAPGMQMAVVVDPSTLGDGNPMAEMRGGRGRRAAPAQSDVDAAVGAIGAIEDLGVGERMLGYPTRRFRAVSKGANGAEEGTVEMWMANVGAAGTAFQKYSESFSGMALGGASASINKAFDAKIPKGSVPLKIVVTNNSRRGKETVTIETVEFKQVRFDPAELEIPPGLQIVDPNAIGRSMGGRGRGGA